MDGAKRAWFVVSLLLICSIGIVIFYYPSIEVDGTGDRGLPTTLRIGVLPDESPERQRGRYEPLLSHLSEQLGLNCELLIPKSYDQLLSLFIEESVDLAYFGAFTYVRARRQANAVPLVMRRIDTRFTSYFLVSGDNTAETLQDLRGKKISFGSRLSTSGHLMPRFFLLQQGIEPETFFSAIKYSGAHDRTAYRVRDGSVALGAANASTVRSMLADGRLKSGEIRILWETPPYANYVWALQPGYDAGSREKLRNAFLQLTPELDSHAAILAGLEAEGFIPADPEFFADLAEIAASADQVFEPESAQ